jgi:ComF family protein
MKRLLTEIGNKSRLFFEDLFAFISSPLCLNCGNALENGRLPLCQSCRDLLCDEFHGEGPICLVCHAPAGIACSCEIDNKFPMPKMYFWGGYTEIMRALIHRFKFEGEQKLGQYLCRMALDVMRDRLAAAKSDYIIPVPLRPHDKRCRGFNQTELIAREVAEEINAVMRPDVLIKTKTTRLQAKLTATERWTNVTDVFAVHGGTNFSGKSILLIDDIVTTGATCHEAAKALYQAGAETITVFALACADVKGSQN